MPDVRKSALQMLFDTLRHHGHLFSSALWERVFEWVLFPIFDFVRPAPNPAEGKVHVNGSENKYNGLEEDAWISETCTLALQLLVDLFVKFYDSVNHLLGKVLELLNFFIKQRVQSLAGIGVSAFVRLMNNAGSFFSDDKWQQVLLYLKIADAEMVPDCA